MPKARVPWGKIEDARDKYIKPKYLPKDVVIKQFHHIRLDDLNALLEHWTSRQAAGKVPLRFTKAVNGIRQDKGTSEGTDDDADAEPDDNDNDDNDNDDNDNDNNDNDNNDNDNYNDDNDNDDNNNNNNNNNNNDDRDDNDNDDMEANRDSQAPENGAPQGEGGSNSSSRSTGQGHSAQSPVGWFLKHSYGRR